MSSLDLRAVLEQVRSGNLEIEAALHQLNGAAVADLGYAHVDLQRHQRCGFPEVIFCEGKTSEWVEGIVRKLQEAGQDCLATRVGEEQAAHLSRCFPQAEQDRIARTFWLPAKEAEGGRQQAGERQEESRKGKVAVVTAGTSDLPVAREAVATARAMGCEVDLLADVGVAGIHRLLRNIQRVQDADVVVVVAGMEGALPSAVGGLVDCPVVAVPTSVGYGAAFHGLAALLCMLNSCAANVTVVNIDSGFKGGYVAALIARGAIKRERVTK
jgi:NCAIR mutase (PurE)-related protein